MWLDILLSNHSLGFKVAQVRSRCVIISVLLLLLLFIIKICVRYVLNFLKPHLICCILYDIKLFLKTGFNQTLQYYCLPSYAISDHDPLAFTINPVVFWRCLCVFLHFTNFFLTVFFLTVYFLFTVFLMMMVDNLR